MTEQWQQKPSVPPRRQGYWQLYLFVRGLIVIHGGPFKEFIICSINIHLAECKKLITKTSKKFLSVLITSLIVVTKSLSGGNLRKCCWVNSLKTQSIIGKSLSHEHKVAVTGSASGSSRWMVGSWIAFSHLFILDGSHGMAVHTFGVLLSYTFLKHPHRHLQSSVSMVIWNPVK